MRSFDFALNHALRLRFKASHTMTTVSGYLKTLVKINNICYIKKSILKLYFLFEGGRYDEIRNNAVEGTNGSSV